MQNPIEVHVLRGTIQSMYLIESKNGLLLFDSGTRADVPMVVDYIRGTLERDLSELKLVCVSHAHPDHSGGAYYFQKKGVPIAGTEYLNEWYAGLTGFFVYLIDVFLTYLVWTKKKKEGDKLKNLFFPRKLLFDYLLEDEKPLPIFSDWVALKTPGHTYSDLSFYHKESESLYVADNLIASSKGFHKPYPIILPESYRASLQKYISLRPKHLLLAHYGSKKFDEEKIKNVINKIPQSSRSHRNSLGGIILSFIKKLFRK